MLVWFKLSGVVLANTIVIQVKRFRLTKLSKVTMVTTVVSAQGEKHQTDMCDHSVCT